MPVDPRMIEMLSYYRDAELHGASLLLRLLKMTRELPEVQVKLTLHVAQETRHAWLWTERIRELGGWPVERYPILDLLAELNAVRKLTVVMVTHSTFGATYGHRTIELADGRIVRDVTAPSRPALHLVSDADPA